MQDPGEPGKDASAPSEEGADEPRTAEDPDGTEDPPPSGTEVSGEASAEARPSFRSRTVDRFRAFRWNTFSWRHFSWRNLSWRNLPWLGPASWRYRPSRFEPGPLGLLGVMLAAMAVTLLLVQTGSGGQGGTGNGFADEPVSVPGPPEGELRVMVVGDSLSQGSSGDYTWRYRLWSHLREADVEVDFVGPYDAMYGLAEEDFGDRHYADPDFDTDHAARWGTSARDLADETARLAAEYEPQYMLVLAGTEDIVSGADADQVLESIGETVSTVRVAQGETRFVIGELPPVEGTGDDGRINSEIGRFNMGVVDLAEQLTASGSPVVIARVADGYVPVRDNWDETHPNTRGEVRIAAAFADALAEPLGVGEVYRRPLPDHLAVGPLTTPEPVAEESEDGLLLTWDDVPGATDYRVVQRRIAPDPDDAVVLPVDVEVDGETRSVLVESLYSGARYEFVVRPLKGRDEGVESEPLQLVWDDEAPPAPSWVRVRNGGATVEWEEVADASHYEVWVRPLDCSVSDDRRVPVTTPDGGGVPSRSDDDSGVAPTPGDTGSPSPDPDPGPGPEPVPEPSRPEPVQPEPVPPDSEPEVRCEPLDGHGPEGGEGWRTLGPSGEDPRWSATVSGAYEVVVRSYRDYVEGGYSDSVLLSEG